MDDNQFRQLLQHLGLSWKGYRRVRKGIKKRIRRHMKQLGCHNVGAYLIELDKNEAARRLCEWMMTVSISRFFRDQRLWETLEKDILPELIGAHRRSLRIWSAGCACGEEVYSLKILWDRLMDSIARLPELEITATDMNPVTLQRAQAAVYPVSSLKAVSESLRSVYFSKKADGALYQVRSWLRNGIRWQIHDLSSEPPGTQFHIIFLRNNLLTYYLDDFKKSALEKVVMCLANGGFLIIGSHERLPPALERNDLLSWSPLSYVFKKWGSSPTDFVDDKDRRI